MINVKEAFLIDPHISKLKRQPISTFSLVVSCLSSLVKGHTLLSENPFCSVFEVALKNLFSQTSEIYCTYVRRYCVFFSIFFCVINVRRATFRKETEKLQKASAHDESHDNLRKTTCHFHVCCNDIAANKLVKSTAGLEPHRK